MSELHGAIRDLLGDDSGWDLVWKRTGYDRIVNTRSKLVVLDPDVTDDWVQAVHDAIDRVRQIQRRHLRLVREDTCDT